MKLKLYYLFLICFSLSSLAQSPDDYRTKMNSVFANISKTPITTGYLSDYGFPFMPLENSNGTLNANNVTNSQIWQMTYATWYSSYIASADIPGVNPATVNTNVSNTLNEATAIPITLLYANYNSLKSNAVSTRLLNVSNNQFNDVPGRTQSPYDLRTLFVAAPAKDASKNNTVSFVFNSALRWGNGGAINSIAIDFGAGYQTASWGIPISYTLPALAQSVSKSD
ncbi:hypothetical protein [Dyadobacter tibetensis]|uniref:hypothetical protein n=1 Tax=Dyadobacter tibetensis TaxID=1211851 RepID=UPI00046EB4E6|nr:hypothetical protein [Dyadobacter tibetensis]